MSDVINHLREVVSPEKYERPEVTEDEKEKLTRHARRMAAVKDDRLRLAYFVAICVENARLVREVNEHRAARGYEPLPVYDPDPKRNGK